MTDTKRCYTCASSGRQSCTTCDGATIGFWQSGDGTLILFVHGALADHQSWVALAPRFGPQFAVSANDGFFFDSGQALGNANSHDVALGDLGPA